MASQCIVAYKDYSPATRPFPSYGACAASGSRPFSDLSLTFGEIRRQLQARPDVSFRVVIGGAVRTLRPDLCDEVYAFSFDALSNAFRHSNASMVEVELEYGRRDFRMVVRDNGSGIDSEVLRSGRYRHSGLSRMKDRTQRVGGRLRILSHAGAGTEVELSIPARVALADHSEVGLQGRWPRFSLGKLRNQKALESVSVQ
jgi:signal transduction histidine kinase